MRILIFSLVFTLLAQYAYAWDASDVKSMDELMLMEDSELNNEAWTTCAVSEQQRKSSMKAP
jgi:hypothetical protein